MKTIGGLLSRGRPGERAEFSAAFIVGAMNAALQNTAQLSAADARAISFRHGTVVVGVSHGAVAGRIQQLSEQLLLATNTKLQASGKAPDTITKIVTRPMTSPSP